MEVIGSNMEATDFILLNGCDVPINSLLKGFFNLLIIII